MVAAHNPRLRLLAAIAAAYAPLGGELIGETIVLPERELSLHGLPHFLHLLTTSPEFTRLPPLFGSDQGLPMASMYVELAVYQSRIQATPALLSPTSSLAAALEERNRRHQARRLSVDDALGTGQHGHVVILGDPGSGKTSLLKRATALIAAGQWPGWILPLYIPLRRYWETRRRYPEEGMSLLRFAASRIVEMNHNPTRTEFVSGVSVLPNVAKQLQIDIDEVCSLLNHLSGAQRKNVIFLLDGLDEIASDREAVEVLSDEIRQLGHGFAWVLTSRRAGFFGGLEENIRFEVVNLDNDGIEQLAHNWFAHQEDEAARSSGAERILMQIMDNPRLLNMARNPFLLTLLCHLHADGALPLYRSQVYERIFKLARAQLCHRENDHTLFGLPELEFLANFCRYLYADAPHAPRHLFDRDDWLCFAAPAEAPDLARHFLKSRLLNQWGEVGDYHLVHLTLHEYLIARALSAKEVPVTEALQRIHQPHWRMVLRFLAGRYRDEGRMADLACLFNAMLTPVDLNGLMYLEVAQLLLEARIDDSSTLLGYDLRETLWKLWCDETPLLAEIAGQALATLAPTLSLERVQALLDDVQGKFSIGANVSMQDIAGNRALKAIRLLAEIQTKTATSLLVNLLLDESRPQLADGAIDALARRNWPAARRAVLDAVATVPAGSASFVRICHLAGFSRHRDFAPYLFAALQAGAAVPDLLIACALVGGQTLEIALLERVQADPI